MLLVCGVLLNKLLKTEDPANIDVLTCYGIQMGPLYRLKLLKLSLAFKEGTARYEELFNIDPCALYPAFIDICIYYVLESL